MNHYVLIFILGFILGCSPEDPTKYTTTRWEKVKRVFVNSPYSVTAILSNGKITSIGCSRAYGSIIEIIDDLQPQQTIYIERTITETSKWDGYRCVSMFVHIHKIKEIGAGGLDRVKFGRSKLHLLE